MGNRGGPRTGIGSVSRRRVLKASGVAGLAATTGLSGCLGTGLLGGGTGYANWLVDPDELDTDHYSFRHTTPGTWVDNEDALDDEVYDTFESLEDQYELTGLDVDEMDAVITFARGTIITGSYDAEEVKEELEDEDFDDDTDHEGYTIYVPDGAESPAIGVSGDAIVRSRGGGDVDAVETVELAIDTKAGEEDRYVDENDDFKELTNQLDGNALVRGGTHEEVEETDTEFGQFEHAVGSGFSIDINGETSEVGVPFVFEEADDIDVDDIEDYVDNTDFFDDIDGISVEKNGRTATIIGETDTDDLTVGFF